jgi:hypothetical protein
VTPSFAVDGAERHASALSVDEVSALLSLADALPPFAAGVRVFADARLTDLLGPDGAVGSIASRHLGTAARPVRAVVFDKSAGCNWAVPWHQDRTIAVQERHQAPGFGPWSVKAGVVHVAPPMRVLEGMATLRVHLDDCDGDNAPLLIAPGSHRLGKVAAGEAAARAAEAEPVACIARAGDIWAYATPILHASERAARPRRRRVVQVDYAAEALPDGLDWLGVT